MESDFWDGDDGHASDDSDEVVDNEGDEENAAVDPREAVQAALDR